MFFFILFLKSIKLHYNREGGVYMEQYSLDLKELLEQRKQAEAIAYVKNLLETKEVNLITLYEEVISESMKSIGMKNQEGRYNIVEEHIATGVMHAVIENTYEYAIRDRQQTNGYKVVIACMQDELHDLGARMLNNTFVYFGFETIYLGSNTPNEVIIDTVKLFQVDYVALSITNFLHLNNLKPLLSELHKLGVKVALGGYAITHNKEFLEELEYEFELKNLRSVGELV